MIFNVIIHYFAQSVKNVPIVSVSFRKLQISILKHVEIKKVKKYTEKYFLHKINLISYN